jgi:hypothetical protein
MGRRRARIDDGRIDRRLRSRPGGRREGVETGRRTGGQTGAAAWPVPARPAASALAGRAGCAALGATVICIRPRCRHCPLRSPQRLVGKGYGWATLARAGQAGATGPVPRGSPQPGASPAATPLSMVWLMHRREAKQRTEKRLPARGKVQAGSVQGVSFCPEDRARRPCPRRRSGPAGTVPKSQKCIVFLSAQDYAAAAWASLPPCHELAPTVSLRWPAVPAPLTTAGPDSRVRCAAAGRRGSPTQRPPTPKLANVRRGRAVTG